MAHKKAGGSTRNGRDSESKRLGVKKFAVNKCWPVISWCVSVEHSSIREERWMWHGLHSFAKADGEVKFEK